jgi:hypothetical protein
MKIRRKTILAAAFGVVLLALFGGSVVSTITGPFDEAAAKKQSYEADIVKRNAKLRAARRARQDLQAWKRRSLPSDPESARQAYQEWLLELVRRVRLQSPSVRGGDASDRGSYDALNFSLSARGAPEQWVRFLYEFYQAGHLHQIRSMSFTPFASQGALDVVVSIEALLLPEANTEDRLASDPESRLALDTLRDYQPILRRDLFGLGGIPDPIDLARVTGIQSLNGVPQVWITQLAEAAPNRAVLKLGKGDVFEIGMWSGKVVDIQGNDVCLESGGEYWIVSIGETLGQALALPAGLFDSGPTPSADSTP